MTTPAIEALQREVAKRGTNVQVAKWLGVSKAHVGDMLKGRRTPGPRILKKLGVKRLPRPIGG